VIKEAKIFEDRTTDEQTPSPCELLVVKIALDRKDGVVVVSSGGDGSATKLIRRLNLFMMILVREIPNIPTGISPRRIFAGLCVECSG